MRLPIYFEDGEMNRGMFADVSATLFHRAAALFFIHFDVLAKRGFTYVKFDVDNERIIFFDAADVEIVSDCF